MLVVAGVGEVSRARLRLAAGVGDRELLVFGAIVVVVSRTVVYSQVDARCWRAAWGLSSLRREQ